MSGAAAPDVLVIGGGIVGAAAAYYLSADGARVLVVDAADPAGGATAGGMGHVVVMDDSPAQLALTAWSRALLLELAAELPPSCEVDRTGTLWIAEDEAQLAAARVKLALYLAHGVRAELLDAQQLQSAEPALREGLAGALRVPDDVVVYPPGLARWLLEQALARGAQVRSRTEVLAIAGGAAITADGEAHAAGVIINAAGAAAPRLDASLQIVPRKGHLVITDRYPRLCTHQLVELGYLGSAHTLNDESWAFNLQPRRTGQLLIGSSRELVGWKAGVNRRLVSRMLQRAVAFVPRLAALNVIRTWTAFRPATPDHLPCIGRTAQPNVFAAAGHEGLGITTALGTGRMLADLVMGRSCSLDPEPYSPLRFAHAVRA